MTLSQLAFEHWGISLAFIVAGGWAGSMLVAAAVKPLESWRRPGDCPRCRGTGRGNP